VEIVGRTTGSHLGLPDEEELLERVRWSAEVTDGLVRTWTLTPVD
jgi:hypothetical protein